MTDYDQHMLYTVTGSTQKANPHLLFVLQTTLQVTDGCLTTVLLLSQVLDLVGLFRQCAGRLNELLFKLLSLLAELL